MATVREKNSSTIDSASQVCDLSISLIDGLIKLSTETIVPLIMGFGGEFLVDTNEDVSNDRT